MHIFETTGFSNVHTVYKMERAWKWYCCYFCKCRSFGKCIHMHIDVTSGEVHGWKIATAICLVHVQPVFASDENDTVVDLSKCLHTELRRSNRKTGRGRTRSKHAVKEIWKNSFPRKRKRDTNFAAGTLTYIQYIHIYFWKYLDFFFYYSLRCSQRRTRCVVRIGKYPRKYEFTHKKIK